jgi:peptidoglycan/LPS O-acetylase OafA/YrhL
MTSTAKITGLDGIRALACLWVVAHHVFKLLPDDVRNSHLLCWVLLRGNLGVPIFFVLSGLLLSFPLLVTYREGGRPRWDVYAVRRLGRILPGYFICLFTCLIAESWVGVGPEPLTLPLAMLFVNSFVPSAYFPSKSNLPLWSIGVEVAFYVLLPFFMLLVFRCRSISRVRLVWLLVVVCLIAWNWLFVSQFCTTQDGIPAFPTNWSPQVKWAIVKNPLALFAHFLFGFLCADILIVLRNHPTAVGLKDTCRRGMNIFDVTAIGFLLIMFLFDTSDSIPGAWRLSSFVHTSFDFPMFHILVAGLLVSVPLSQRVGCALDTRFFRLTASLSFGIYLWHAFVLEHCKGSLFEGSEPATPLQAFRGLAVVLAVSYAIAALSYYLIELPVQRRAQVYGRGPASPRATKINAGADGDGRGLKPRSVT